VREVVDVDLAANLQQFLLIDISGGLDAMSITTNPSCCAVPLRAGTLYLRS
jgi:hypothetical protein